MTNRTEIAAFSVRTENGLGPERGECMGSISFKKMIAEKRHREKEVSSIAQENNGWR
jgi:hypothetical protein